MFCKGGQRAVHGDFVVLDNVAVDDEGTIAKRRIIDIRYESLAACIILSRISLSLVSGDVPRAAKNLFEAQNMPASFFQMLFKAL